MQQFNSSKINGIDVFYDVLLMDLVLLPYQFNAYFSRIKPFMKIPSINLDASTFQVDVFNFAKLDIFLL